MEQTYSHHHVAQAHHAGLVIGAIGGSLAITVVIAITSVALNPNLLLHPLSFTSEISAKPTTSQTTDDMGLTATTANSNIRDSRPAYGTSAQTALTNR